MKTSNNDNSGICEAECLECGIKLRDEEIVEVHGETLCEACAEDYMRESDNHGAATSVDDPCSDRGARLH